MTRLGRRKINGLAEFDAIKKALFGDAELSQEGFIPRVTHDLYGNGKKGILDRMQRVEWMLWPVYGGLAAIIILLVKIIWTGKP